MKNEITHIMKVIVWLLKDTLSMKIGANWDKTCNRVTRKFGVGVFCRLNASFC